MLFEYMRLFKESGGTLTDLSLDNQDDSAVMTPDLIAGDYYYIGQYFPINNLYFRLGDTTVSSALAQPTIEYWSGQEWRVAVDLLDATSNAGATLAKSGVLQFSPDRHYGWQRSNDTSDNNSPSELNSLVIYDCYWLRISFNNPPTTGMEIKEVSYTFTDTQQLEHIDIEINEYYAAFKSGKTDWIDEIITSSKMLLIDLKRQGLVDGRGQVLRFDDVFMAATYKTLELIYMNLGPSYKDKKDDVRSLYTEALNVKRFSFDQNKDGLLNQREITGTIKRLVR